MGILGRGLFKALIGFVLLSSFLTTHSYAKAPSCARIFDLKVGLYSGNGAVQEAGVFSSLRYNPRLKVVTWNLLDLKIPEAEYPYGSKIYRETPENLQLKDAKSEGQLLQMKRVFDDINADIYVLQEVFSRESLQYLVREFLGDKYHVVVERGNDERGIQVGFLIKKSLNVSYEIQSHKDLRLQNDYGVYPRGTPIFARDLPALYLRQMDGSNARAKDDPDLVVLGAHFKSKRPTAGDFESTNRRELEARTAAQIFSEINNRYDGKVPVALLLDSNASYQAAETQSLRSVAQETLSIAPNKITEEDRVTHTYHPRKGMMNAKQVDMQFVNKALATRLLKSYVYRFKDTNGKNKVYEGKWESKEYPLTIKHRNTNPSDHMPVVAIYDMTKK